MDAEAIDNSHMQTWELGYKGIIKDRIFLTCDIWVSKNSNYVSPLTLSTASAIFNPEELRAALGPADSTGLLFNNLQLFDFLLVGLLDSTGTYSAEPNGTAYDEIVNIVMGAAQGIPNGSVTPEDDLVGYDIILVYRNLGDIWYGGADLGLTVLLTDDLEFSAAYSFVNKDKFELEGAAGGFVSLNAPKNKVSAALAYRNENSGLGGKLGFRWQQGFEANSAVYIGDVEAASFLDLNLSYQLPFDGTKVVLSMDIKNILNNKHQRFPGTPEIGTIALWKAAVTF